jgi:hypothetical protein
MRAPAQPGAVWVFDACTVYSGVTFCCRYHELAAAEWAQVQSWSDDILGCWVALLKAGPVLTLVLNQLYHRRSAE